MNPTTGPTILSPDLALAVDQACDRFEKALRSGNSPSVVDFLTAVPEPARPALEAELLALCEDYKDATFISANAGRQDGDELGRLGSYPAYGAMGLYETSAPNSTSQTHPSLQMLRRFGNGEILGSEADLIAKHVEACDHCCQQLRDLTDHPLLARLRMSQRQAACDAKSGKTFRYDFLSPAEAADELGRLGDYRVLQVLGQGGMGIVFKAEDPHLQRFVALKAMLPSLAADATSKERFFREARAAAQLKHDHVVGIHQVGQDRGIPFLAMEFLEGQSLEQRLAHEKILPIPEVLRIGREVAEGLAAAHQRGLMHRDIKPANIWLEKRDLPRGAKDAPSCRVKILDFGLARGVQSGDNLTQSGTIIGTPAFMAPEQAQLRGADQRADLFSLGCVLFVMCTGERPFKGQDTLSILMALASQDAPSPRQVNPAVPQQLADLITRLLAKDPQARPGSAREVVETLQTIERDLAAPPPSAPPAVAPAAAVNKRKVRSWPRAGLFIGVLLFLAVLAGAATYLFRLSTPEGDFFVEVADDSVAVAIEKQGGIKLIDRHRKGKEYWIKARQSRTLPAGEYELLVTDPDSGLEFSTRTFSIRGKDTARVRVWFRKTTPQDDAKPPRTESAKLAPLLQIPEPPPLAEWLKGRTVLTVAQNGTGQFKTIEAALKSLKPGQVVKVLDRGPYRERLIVSVPKDSGLISDQKSVLELSHWTKDTFGHAFYETDGFRLNGFVLEFPVEKKDGRGLYVPHPKGFVLENCLLQTLANGRLHSAVALEWRQSDAGAAWVRECVIRGRFALAFDSTSPKAVAVAQRNIVPSFNCSAKFDRLVVRQNVFEGPPPSFAAAWLQAEVANPLEFSNNTLCSEYPISVAALPHGSLVVRNNLHGKPGLLVFRREAEKQLAGAGRTFDVNHNGYPRQLRDGEFDSSEKSICATMAGDVLAEPHFLSENPSARDYLRIPTDSPLATRGAGGAWPSYIGALPPGPAPKDGDWFTRLRETWGEYVNQTQSSIPLSGQKLPTSFKNKLGMEFVLVPRGKSWLGGGWNGRVGTEADIDHDFFLGKYEVTQEQWQKVMGANPSHFQGAANTTNHLPVEQVSWEDCQKFIKLVNEKAKESGWVYRLPTELEWEYACRGGPMKDDSESAYDFYFEKPTSTLLPQQANFKYVKDSKQATCKVGSFRPNRLGLYDMHGNVWEWCQDAVKDDKGAPARVYRGGCWYHDASNCIARSRSIRLASFQHSSLGLRLARVPYGTPISPYTNSLGMKFALIPKGQAWLGGGKDRPGSTHVSFANDFYLGVYEVTQEEWQRVMGKQCSGFARGGEFNYRLKDVPDADLARYPAENMTWEEAQTFVKKLNQLAHEAGWEYRLPTSAEWEYACRGGPMKDKAAGAFDFYFAEPTNELTQKLANVEAEGIKVRPAKVGSYRPNALGLFDMHGNVMEWCADLEVPDGRDRLLRSGSFGRKAADCRAAFAASRDQSKFRDGSVGLRLARVRVENPSPMGKRFKNNFGMEFALIPKGQGWLGGGKGQPGKSSVWIQHDFYLGVYEVTQEDWLRIMGKQCSEYSREGPKANGVSDVLDADLARFPAENMTWEEAKRFVGKLNERDPRPGWEYRLPTSAQWEYACRGGPMKDRMASAFDYHFAQPANELRSTQANFKAAKERRPCKVGSYEPNALGLHDMHGNVMEWCADAEDDAANPHEVTRVMRGGSFHRIADECGASFSTSREQSKARFTTVGLRLAYVPIGTAATGFANSLGMRFALVPKGKSWLGGGAGKPGTKPVAMPHDFYLGVYEVTQEEWLKVMGANPSSFSRDGGKSEAIGGVLHSDQMRFPVENISCLEAQAFVKRLNERAAKPGWKYRLPTQQEWEFACRGGPMTELAQSTFDFYLPKPSIKLRLEDANSWLSGLRRPCKVGSYPPNRLGLFDMHGNVYEWCQDGLPGIALLRGGSFNSEPAEDCRAAPAVGWPVNYVFHNAGLRVACVPVK